MERLPEGKEPEVAGNAIEASLALVRQEVGRVLESVSPEELAAAARAIAGSRGIFVAGAGRSGLALRMIAMRLMHLGLAVFVVGDATTPAIGGDDLLLVASASGTTAGTVHTAELAKKAGASVLLLTTAPASPLAQRADVSVVLPASAKTDTGERSSRQYAGSLFEQAVLLVMDAVFDAVWHAGQQTADTLMKRHANLE